MRLNLIRDVGSPFTPHFCYDNILFARATSDVILMLVFITFAQTNTMIRFLGHQCSASTAFPLSVPESTRQTLG